MVTSHSQCDGHVACQHAQNRRELRELGQGPTNEVKISKIHYSCPTKTNHSFLQQPTQAHAGLVQATEMWHDRQQRTCLLLYLTAAPQPWWWHQPWPSTESRSTTRCAWDFEAGWGTACLVASCCCSLCTALPTQSARLVHPLRKHVRCSAFNECSCVSMCRAKTRISLTHTQVLITRLPPTRLHFSRKFQNHDLDKRGTFSRSGFITQKFDRSR
jgi:hypothetical protein